MCDGLLDISTDMKSTKETTNIYAALDKNTSNVKHLVQELFVSECFFINTDWDTLWILTFNNFDSK